MSDFAMGVATGVFATGLGTLIGGWFVIQYFDQQRQTLLRALGVFIPEVRPVSGGKAQ